MSWPLSGATADPTPKIDSVTLDRPLVTGDTAVATITGSGFGLLTPTVVLSCSADNVTPGCSDSDIVVESMEWAPGSSTIEAHLWVANTLALGDYDVQVISAGSNVVTGFQGPQPRSNRKGPVTVVAANMTLQKIDFKISPDEPYTENTTIQVTAVRPDNGQTIPRFIGSVSITEVPPANGPTIYSQNVFGNLPSGVTIASGGTTTFTAISLAGPSSPTTPPADAQIRTVNYPLYGGGTFAIAQWVVTGNGTQVDPAHAGAPAYDWFETRAKKIFTETGDVAAVLASVSRYRVYLTETASGQIVGGLTDPGQGPQTTININPFSNGVRTNFSATYTACGQTFKHQFRDVFLHEARHAYQFAQVAIVGNDQDGDLLPGNPVPVAPSTIIQDTTTPRTVCNEFTGDGATFTVAYHGDTIPDLRPGDSNPPPAGDTSPYVNYAQEMDAHTFSSRQN